jgi:hypothetical protein
VALLLTSAILLHLVLLCRQVQQSVGVRAGSGVGVLMLDTAMQLWLCQGIMDNPY